MPVDLFLLCGFLGSGKTSLLVDFLKADGAANTGVIVNEAGEIGVDGAIVANDSDSVPMTLLANGCVCCSLRSDLVFTIGALLDAPRAEGLAPLERIILETSGVSRPGPIIASLADPDLARRQLRLTVVCTDDCSRSPEAIAEFDEALAQFAAAHRIVLTKTDLIDEAGLEERRAHAQAMNPLAQVIASANRQDAVCAAFASSQTAGNEDIASQAVRALMTPSASATGWLATDSRPAQMDHDRLRVIAAQPRDTIAWTEFAEWLDDLAGLCGDRLLRLKAVVRVTDSVEPILIQSVGTTFSAPMRLTRQPQAPSAIILIVRDLDAAQIRAMAPDAPVEILS